VDNLRKRIEVLEKAFKFKEKEDHRIIVYPHRGESPEMAIEHDVNKYLTDYLEKNPYSKLTRKNIRVILFTRKEEKTLFPP